MTGMLARRVGVPSVLTVVGNDIKKYIFSPEKVGACRSGLENADRVVALSRDLVEMAHALHSYRRQGPDYLQLRGPPGPRLVARAF